MTRHFLLLLAAACGAAGLSLGQQTTLYAQDVAAESSTELTAEQEGVETLTRGPLHEAFAEPVAANPGPGLTVKKEPPAPIEEVAPEYKPEGDETTWIPGYWAWDDERDDYIWISGVYRVPPPGQRWVPGYWQQAADGWQWIPGFWLGANVEELSYQDPPPESLENGPSSPAPGDDYFYAAGYWNYTSAGYRWQPGYWYPCYNDYMWIPPRHIWTPRGCIFTAGYWDWRFSMRGCAFAPAYINRSFYSRPGWAYRPGVVLNTQLIFSNLFVRPNYHHYMFGNYYGNQYARWNIQPAFAYHGRRGGYDPMMSFYSAFYRRQGEDFIASQRQWHDRKVRDESLRPARDWSDLVAHGRAGGRGPNAVGVNQNLIAQTLQDAVRGNNRDDIKFVKLDDNQRDALSKRSQMLRDMTKERLQAEKLAEGARPAPRPDARPDATANAQVKSRGRLPLPKTYEPYAAARANPDDPAARPNVPGRGRDVPPPAQPDLKDVREDLRGRVGRPEIPRADRPNTPSERPERPRVERPETPRVERPNVPGERPERPRVERPETPRVDRPNVPGERPERPRIERPETPRVDRPNVPVERPETPRVDRPEVPGNRPERPNVDRTQVDRPRVERPIVPTDRPPPRPDRGPMNPMPNQPRVERPNVDRSPTPRVEQPAQPRVERPQTPARAERPQTPRVERPQTPRVERAPAPARAQQPQRQPRAERPARPERPATPRGNGGKKD